MAQTELDWQKESGWMIITPTTTTVSAEKDAPDLKDLVDETEDFKRDLDAQFVDVKFRDGGKRIAYKAIWLHDGSVIAPVIEKPVNETPLDISDEPVSRIVTDKETEIVMVTEKPTQEKAIKRIGQAYMLKFAPTRLVYEHGTATKDTPEGEVTTPVLIWHATWDNKEEEELPTLLDEISLQ